VASLPKGLGLFAIPHPQEKTQRSTEDQHMRSNFFKWIIKKGSKAGIVFSTTSKERNCDISPTLETHTFLACLCSAECIKLDMYGVKSHYKTERKCKIIVSHFISLETGVLGSVATVPHHNTFRWRDATLSSTDYRYPIWMKPKQI